MIHFILVLIFVFTCAFVSVMVFVCAGVALGAALGGDDKEVQDAFGMIGYVLCILFACYMGYLLPGSAIGQWISQ